MNASHMRFSYVCLRLSLTSDKEIFLSKNTYGDFVGTLISLFTSKSALNSWALDITSGFSECRLAKWG